MAGKNVDDLLAICDRLSVIVHLNLAFLLPQILCDTASSGFSRAVNKTLSLCWILPY